MSKAMLGLTALVVRVAELERHADDMQSAEVLHCCAALIDSIAMLVSVADPQLDAERTVDLLERVRQVRDILQPYIADGCGRG